MVPQPSLISSLVPRPGWLTRLVMQIAASTLLTIFYTPGGAAGWVMDLVLRFYPGVARRLAPLRLIPIYIPTRRILRSVQK
ncbi:MAG TPA: hypothetical protein VFH68_24125 [Polyangia bacterium]|jgi:hypothetical protein|nr:hypothetical protein [Polyangia bacterium]